MSTHSHDPRILWERVVRAQGELARQRHVPANGPCAAARDELLAALEAYVDSLKDHGRPTPYVLRDQIRIQRLTRSADRYQRYGTAVDWRRP